MVRNFVLALSIVLFGVFTSAAQVETFKLNNGQEVAGELLPNSANDQGVQVKVAEGKYERILWPNLNQEDLRRLAQNPRYRQFAEPFIEISQEERIKATEVPIKQPERLELPKRQSLIGAMFSSPVGIFLLVVLWGRLCAGYEVALYRAQPPGLVAGLSAIPFVGVLVPIIFLCMPTRLPKEEPPPRRRRPCLSTTTQRRK